MRKFALPVLLAALNVLLLLFLPAQEPGGQEPVVPAPTHIGEGEYCIDCHASYLEAEFVHEPVAEEMCEACHEQPDESLHTFDTPKDQSANCSMCHDSPEGKNVHQPFADGDCSGCHDPHNSEFKALLHTDKQKDLCISCHPQSPNLAAQHVHGPVSAGMCTLCHMPHASDHGQLLVDEPVSLCLSCHEDFDERLNEAENIHIPVDEDCGLCHDAHATEFPFQLTKPSPSLCFDCHDDIQKRTELAVEHGAAHDDRNCLNCHRPHHSDQAALQEKRGDKVCLDCHSESVPGKDDSEVLAMGDVLALEFKHGPILEGNCSSCHDPHGSETEWILRDPYPRRFYSSWDPGLYKLCFGCHEENAFSDPKTADRTQFRDGETNLHYLHVNRDRKGRTCRACHEVHASSKPMHIAETVPFGGWSLPLNYEKTKYGGSCSPGCHDPQTYTRAPVSKEEE